LLGKKNSQAKQTGVGIEDVNAAFHAGAGGRAGQERSINQLAGRMQRDSGDLNAARDLLKLGGSGNGTEGEIGSARLGDALGLESEHGAVRGCSQIGGGRIGRGGDELVGCVRIAQISVLSAPGRGVVKAVALP
jgi:hypothetical protein